ncbi:hypothetical protein GRZ55_11485 [Chelativorans sp. ZYF759]|uniref:hypothetical protein n=1 Tax=Chelativorans sp. ZYF759 TaxID=2692213 RepID=UPI00145F527E|nr:hypothetical protein [Chelativorans sp. ZYF759]NMG39865.1 hypothetical protein [Chelativorans sp. ZYF759]
MTRKLDITARQVTALCKGAQKAGYAPVIQLGDVFVRLVPEERACAESQRKDENYFDQMLDDWSLLPRRPLPSKGEALSRSDLEVSRSGRHESDPQRSARHAKVLTEWKRDLPGSALDHRETRVMEQLLQRADEPQSASTLEFAGPATLERLVIRGFIGTLEERRPTTLTLTSAGKRAFATNSKEGRRRIRL